MEKCPYGDRLPAGKYLTAGQYLKSNNGAYFAVLQKDGNLVVYTSGDFHHKNAQWASHTDGKGKGPHTLWMQLDGNLVIYDANDNPTWASKTDGTSGDYVIMQNDRNLVLYDRIDKPLWCSKTAFD